MIQIFMSKRGSGKSKYMISHANNGLKDTKGHIVFIDDDNRAMHELDREENFELRDLNSLYGFICGIVSQDYDVDMIYVDGLMGKMDFDRDDAKDEFEKLSKLSDRSKITIFFALNDTEETPEYLKKYKVEIE